MPSVKLKDNEPFDIALRRFKRSCEKAGVLAEVRRRESTRSQHQFVSVKLPLLLSVTPRKSLAKLASSNVYTRP